VFKSVGRGSDNSGGFGTLIQILIYTVIILSFLPVLINKYMKPKNSSGEMPASTALSLIGNIISVPFLFFLTTIRSEEYLEQALLPDILGYIYLVSIGLAIWGVLSN